MSGQTGQPAQTDEGQGNPDHRRTLRRFQTTLDELLEWFAIVQTFPARRADDPALRDAIEQARPPIAEIVAVLERMERPDADNQKGA